MKIRSGWKRETIKIKFGSTGWKSKRPIRSLEKIKTKQTTNQIARTMRREFRAVNQSKRPIRFENFGQSDWSVELVPRRAVNGGTRTSCQSNAFLDSDWTFAFFLESDWSFAFSASWAESYFARFTFQPVEPIFYLPCSILATWAEFYLCSCPKYTTIFAVNALNFEILEIRTIKQAYTGALNKSQFHFLFKCVAMKIAVFVENGRVAYPPNP